MLAIHNYYSDTYAKTLAANAFAKLSKCQQFTTENGKISKRKWLQTLLQSYQNVSNSQRMRLKQTLLSSCKRFCKVIKMLAIHNHSFNNSISHVAANAFAKLSKCQQFTTRWLLIRYTQQLQTLLQSYQNVSNSQQGFLPFLQDIGCKRFCKVIKMLAIHNNALLITSINPAANAFAKLSKCQQFTTMLSSPLKFSMLQTLLQSYQNVSNSQHSCTLPSPLLAANAFAKLSKCQQFTTSKY